MTGLKVYRVQLPDHLVEQVDFLILARTMRLAKWNAQNLLIHRGYKHWAQIHVDAVDSATAEALIGGNPDSYVIHNQPPKQTSVSSGLNEVNATCREAIGMDFINTDAIRNAPLK